MVEVGDKIAILVVAGENSRIGRAPRADPEALSGQGNQAALEDPQLVGMAVLVVVVVDKIVEADRGFGRIVGHAAAIDGQDTGGVGCVHAKRFREKVPGASSLGQIRHPADGLLISYGTRKSSVPFGADARVFAVLVVQVEFSIEIKSTEIAHLGANPEELVGRGQTVVEDDLALVRPVFDISRGLSDQQELGLADGIGLPVRAHFDAVVVGHKQVEAHVFDAAYSVLRLG